jgi:predicted nucleic acid-binding protein
MLVIADTSPISYLVLIGEQEILPVLFGRVFIPSTVFQELQATVAPPPVARWIAHYPNWLEIRATTHAPDVSLFHLDPGEREAILLAEELAADLLLMDEKAARKEAASRNLPTSGTLGVLDLAAEKGLVDFSQVFGRLKQTSFYVSASVERFFLERHAQRKSSRKK